MDDPVTDLDDGISFVAPLWLWNGDAAWHFVTVPPQLSDAIEFRTAARDEQRGFGSVRVEVTVGETTWRTSLFPDSRRGAYVLPVKREVRKRENLELDADVVVSLRLVAG